MTELKTLQIKRDGGWLSICLNRPETRNSLSADMVEELIDTLNTIADNREIRGITFRGNGGTFCAGGDLKGFKTDFQSGTVDTDAIEAASHRAGELYHRINTMPQVVLMLVEGAAMAGGLGMVCAGDVVAVTTNAKFALTEVTLGIPPAQIAPFVIARLGMRVGRRLMLTAARFLGAEAGELGLADYVVETPDDLAKVEAHIRQSVERCAPGAIAVTKDIILKTTQLDSEAMREHAARGFASCLADEEAREGIAAFLEKRKPEWQMQTGENRK